MITGWLQCTHITTTGVDEFDDSLRPDEPNTPGANYQRYVSCTTYVHTYTSKHLPRSHRQLMKKYLSRGTPLLPCELSRKSDPVLIDVPPVALKRDSTGSGGMARSPTLMRTGSLRMPMRSTSLPTSPRSVSGETTEDAEESAKDKAGWWSRMDSAQMNRQVEEGDGHYLGSYKPQFDVAGNTHAFAEAPAKQ